MLKDKTPPLQLVQLQNFALARENAALLETLETLGARLKAAEESLAEKTGEAAFFGSAFSVIRSAYEQHLGGAAGLGGQKLEVVDRLVSALSPVDRVPGPHGYPLRQGGEDRVAPAERPIDNDEKSWSTWRHVAGPRWPALAELPRHEGKPGRPRIAVFGTGAIGDTMQLSPLLRELAKKFAPCDMALFHTNGVFATLYQRDPHLRWLCHIDKTIVDSASLLCDVLTRLDLFDLVVALQGYVPKYLKCRNSRIGGTEIDRWLGGNADINAILRPMTARSPLRNGLIGRLVRPFGYLDLLGFAAGLPIDSRSPLGFFPDPRDVDALARWRLPPVYVTVHDGVDRGMAVELQAGKRSTKQLPQAAWRRIVAIAKDAGLSVVQIGAEGEPPIEGVDVDLCGKTTLSELPFVLKGAVLHLDTEGGLVHLARAMNTRSVVWFGPTSASFFGYPDNINILPETCGDCWWIDPKWITECCRETERVAGAEGPECMTSHGIDGLADLLSRECQARRRVCAPVAWRLESATTDFDAGQLFAALQSRLRLSSAPQAKVLLLGAALRSLARELAEEGYDVRLLIPPDPDDPAAQLAGETFDVDFASPFNLPAETTGYELVVCAETFAGAAQWRAVIGELLRPLKPFGAMILGICAREDAATLFADLNRALDGLDGLDPPFAFDIPRSGPILAGGLVLERR